MYVKGPWTVFWYRITSLVLFLWFSHLFSFSGTFSTPTYTKEFQMKMSHKVHVYRVKHRNNRSITSSKASSLQSAIQCFLFQFPAPSLFLNVIQLLLTSSFSTSRHFYPSHFFPSVTYFIRQFERNVCSIQIRFLLFLLYTFLSFLTLVILRHFSHERPNWSSASFLQHHVSKLSKYFWSTCHIIYLP